MKKNNHVLGIPRKRSGAFEHAWELVQNLFKKNSNTSYYSNWFDTPTYKVNLSTEKSEEFDVNHLNETPGIFNLQTQTYEYNGLLDLIKKNSESKIIYNLHAIIPYTHYIKPEQKKDFLEGNFSPEQIKSILENLSEREKAQMSGIWKADCLITISKNHKLVLERLNIKKPTYVLENVSDFHNLNEEKLKIAYEESGKFREELGTENIITYCGTVYEKKGAVGAFESFNMIKDKWPHSKLLLLGSAEKDKDKFISFGLKKENLKDIFFVPWINKSKERDRFLKYYLASDVLLQPVITDELYSKTVIDAMTLGIPTISCRSPYTFGSSENAEAIFKSFSEIKTNPEKVKKVTDLAKEKIKRENNWDSYISKLEEIIRSLN